MIDIATTIIFSAVTITEVLLIKFCYSKIGNGFFIVHILIDVWIDINIVDVCRGHKVFAFYKT